MFSRENELSVISHCHMVSSASAAWEATGSDPESSYLGTRVLMSQLC